MHIRRWVDEGHNVTSPEEILAACQSHGGVKASKFILGSVAHKKSGEKQPEWKGISQFHNFAFEQFGIRAWKYYRVGNGELFPNRLFAHYHIDAKFIEKKITMHNESERIWNHLGQTTPDEARRVTKAELALIDEQQGEVQTTS